MSGEREAARNECEKKSLILFTINSHNFTFSLAAHGSEERRAIARGLRSGLFDAFRSWG